MGRSPTRTNATDKEEPEPKRRCLELQANEAQAQGTYPLVAREAECARLDSFLEESLFSGTKGGSLYMSGGPGTGKTCCARAATAALRGRHQANLRVIEVNCCRLAQRSTAGLLKHLATVNPDGTKGRGQVSQTSPEGLALAAAFRLAALGGPLVVLIVDEVDQLVTRGRAPIGALDDLFQLPLVPGAPRLAILAIANAVDLLERGTTQSSLCSSLLFEPYTAPQFRSIVKSRLAAGGFAETPFNIALELQIRSVAKASGDCRVVARLCDEMLAGDECPGTPSTRSPASEPDSPSSEASSSASSPVSEASRRGPRPVPKPHASDPLAPVDTLPMECQVLLCALATGSSEVEKLSSLQLRFREFMKQLHQPTPSSDQVNRAVTFLQAQGLVEAKKKRERGADTQTLLELMVSRKRLSARLAQTNPMLKQCLS